MTSSQTTCPFTAGALEEACGSVRLDLIIAAGLLARGVVSSVQCAGWVAGLEGLSSLTCVLRGSPSVSGSVFGCEWAMYFSCYKPGIAE